MSEHKSNKAIYILVFIIALAGVFLVMALGFFWLKGEGPLSIDYQSKKTPLFEPSSAEVKTVYASAQEEVTQTRRNAIVRAAEKVGPAVVSISVVQIRTVRESPFFSPFRDDLLDDFWGRFFQPREYKQKVYSLGSGVIISEDGDILTNEHVVRQAEELKVTLPDGREYRGKLVGQDFATDLAVIRIEGKDFPYAPLGDSDDLIIGEWAIALGNPFGYLLDDPQPTVTVGVISALNRNIKKGQGEERVYRKMIQTDAAINLGNSGGPLVNAEGEVIGINTFIFTTSRGSEGIGFAIPINRVKRVISDLIDKGKVEKGWVGLRVQDLTPLLAQSLNLEEKQGVIVIQVEKGSPAEKARIKRGDLIKEINQERIRDKADFQDYVSFIKPGDRLKLSLVREKKNIHTEIQVQKEPEIRLSEEKEDFLGIRIAQITSQLADKLNLSGKSGVIITAVEEKGKGKSLGLREGDVIREINNAEIKDMGDYKKAMSDLKKARMLVMVIERKGGLYMVSTTL